jgi:hypothetical protein
MFYIGIDLGKSRDHTAIVIVRRADRRLAWMPPVFEGLAVCYAERVPLGTSYPQVVERVRQIVMHPKLHGQCVVVVDATGVGAPVVDMLRAARLGCDITPVVITGGEKASGGSVPKKDLLAGVQVLLERRELKIAPTLREAGTLVRELTDVKMTAAGKGRVRLGAEGPGEHDDLVVALGLAVWGAMRPVNGFGVGRLPGI